MLVSQPERNLFPKSFDLGSLTKIPTRICYEGRFWNAPYVSGDPYRVIPSCGILWKHNVMVVSGSFNPLRVWFKNEMLPRITSERYNSEWFSKCDTLNSHLMSFFAVDFVSEVMNSNDPLNSVEKGLVKLFKPPYKGRNKFSIEGGEFCAKRTQKDCSDAKKYQQQVESIFKSKKDEKGIQLDILNSKANRRECILNRMHAVNFNPEVGKTFLETAFNEFNSRCFERYSFYKNTGHDKEELIIREKAAFNFRKKFVVLVLVELDKIETNADRVEYYAQTMRNLKSLFGEVRKYNSDFVSFFFTAEES